MYKHLVFLDSKTLDWLTPYSLDLASDTIAFNVFMLTFVSVVFFYFLNPMLSLMAVFLGVGLCGRILVAKMVCFRKARAKG